MTEEERKKFECPGCGGDSWLNVVTLKVEHAEPKCVAWQAAQNQVAAALVVASQEAAGAAPGPTVIEFVCPECKAPARMRPLETPIPVEHSLPHCEAWEKIAGKKDDVERYLIKAGVHIHVPNRA